MKLLPTLLASAGFAVTVSVQAATVSGEATLDWSKLTIDFTPNSGELRSDASGAQLGIQSFPGFSSFAPGQNSIFEESSDLDWAQPFSGAVTAKDTATGSSAVAESLANDSVLVAKSVLSSGTPQLFDLAGTTSIVTRVGKFVATGDGELDVSIPYSVAASTDNAGIGASAIAAIQFLINDAFSANNSSLEAVNVGLTSGLANGGSGVL